MEAKVRPLRREVEELKSALDEWKNELSGSNPDVKQVLKEISDFVYYWHSYGLGSHVKEKKVGLFG